MTRDTSVQISSSFNKVCTSVHKTSKVCTLCAQESSKVHKCAWKVPIYRFKILQPVNCLCAHTRERFLFTLEHSRAYLCTFHAQVPDCQSSAYCQLHYLFVAMRCLGAQFSVWAVAKHKSFCTLGAFVIDRREEQALLHQFMGYDSALWSCFWIRSTILNCKNTLSRF